MKRQELHTLVVLIRYGIGLLVGVAILQGVVVIRMYHVVNELGRRLWNVSALVDCDPAFAAQAQEVIREVESVGFHPWIQESWRSRDAQERALQNGKTELRFGFHNITGPHGERRAFAIDLVEDRRSNRPSVRYALVLAATAHRHGLTTGLLWGLPDEDRVRLQAAVTTLAAERSLALGRDPCHLEPDNTSICDAVAQAGSVGIAECMKH